MRYAIIPARGGSKRIPRKNVKMFSGKPMIQHSIDTAFAAGVFDAVIVSTDDDLVAQVARAAGAEVPFQRPAELADDHASTAAVMSHAVNWLRMEGKRPAEVCCFYATAPFTQAEDLKAGLDALMQPGIRFAFPVTEFDAPIQRALMLGATGGLEMREPEHFNSRSQDLEHFFHDAGQFYWGVADAWENQERIFSKNTRVLEIPSYRVQDIDTPADWIKAELMFEALSRIAKVC